MAKAPAKRGPKAKDSTKKIKKKISILVSERVDYVDYKDVNLLQRFVSDRSKIRARRVSGNDVQQQRDRCDRAHHDRSSSPLFQWCGTDAHLRTHSVRVSSTCDSWSRPTGTGSPLTMRMSAACRIG